MLAHSAIRHRPRKMWLGRCYWHAVKRWPVLHVLTCAWGLFLGGFCLFITPEPGERGVLFVKVLGLLMMAVYGWILTALIWRLKQRTWRHHCDRRILFFSGMEESIA